MLISKENKFIFIHVSKVGGQSITNALMPFAATRWQSAIHPVIPFRLQLKVFTKLKQHFGIRFMPQPYDDHVFAKDVVRSMGLSNFENYFSFGFVRNPWARIVSIYTYARANRRHYLHREIVKLGSFEEFVRWNCLNGRHIHSQAEYLCDESCELIVDYVGKLESLERDFEVISQRIGQKIKLPVYNVSRRDDYRDYYDSETKALVERSYADDSRLFNYQF